MINKQLNSVIFVSYHVTSHPSIVVTDQIGAELMSTKAITFHHASRSYADEINRNSINF
jgi:hypothetical protein